MKYEGWGNVFKGLSIWQEECFRDNPFLEGYMVIGITRKPIDVLFSDLKDLEVITAVSERCGNCVDFISQEVDTALEGRDLSDIREEVQERNVGYNFGTAFQIYNPER